MVETQTQNMARMDDGELFRTIMDASFTSLADIIGQIAAWAEPYFPLGALETVWLQVLLSGALVYVCIYGRRNLTHFGTFLRRSDSEAAATEVTPAKATAAVGHRKASTAANRAGELSVNLAGTFIGCYALISAFIGILNIYAWVLLAISG